jgi:hypothetical protein
MPARDGKGRRRSAARYAAARARATVDALEHLVGGFGTGILAMAALLSSIVTTLACLIGVGVVLAPAALRVVRSVADRERARLSRRGPEIIGPEPLPDGVRAALTDRAVLRELAWMVTHAFTGLILGTFALTLPLRAVQDATFWMWWWLLPPEEAANGALELWIVHDLPTALGTTLLALIWITLTVALAPGLAWLQAWPGRRLLAPASDVDLSLRVAQLTATRAAALDAHATE